MITKSKILINVFHSCHKDLRSGKVLKSVIMNIKFWMLNNSYCDYYMFAFYQKI